jgi:signal transduction histidine kinase
VGIREEDRAAVFAAFYRSHRAGERRRRGSGLGLAICRQVMEAHQGSIHVARSSPDGTTFELTFPRP